MTGQNLSTRLRRWWPARGGGSLVSTFILVLCAGAFTAGVLPLGLALPVFVLGWAWQLRDYALQAKAERLARTLLAEPASNRMPLLQTLSRVSQQLQALDGRLAKVHPVTNFPTREHLVSAVTASIQSGPSRRVLGAIRFTDFDRLASFDHLAANAALERFARRLQSAAKPVHVIAQIDRDCFAIWFDAQTPIDDALAEFKAIVYVACQEIDGSDAVLTPRVEAASVMFPQDGDDAQQLLLRVIAGLARPSAFGNGQITLPTPPSVEVVRQQFSLEQDLAQAICQEQLTMAFQPIVDLTLGRLMGAEALLRWRHPTLGFVSPAHFIPIVEATGMSEQYGLWVLNAACREARRWRDAGMSGLKMAVNVSARQLLDPQFQTKIQRTLDRHELDPSALELELTETAAMADAGRTLRLFAQLQAMGVSLAIDDFGSGYSSLSYLKNLPFNKLKIDREFVAHVDERRDSQSICRALIELGRGLNLVVLAEGVETEAEVQALRALGCSVFQGYHFAKALTGDAFVALARDAAWTARLKVYDRTGGGRTADHVFA